MNLRGRSKYVRPSLIRAKFDVSSQFESNRETTAGAEEAVMLVWPRPGHIFHFAILGPNQLEKLVRLIRNGPDHFITASSSPDMTEEVDEEIQPAENVFIRETT